MRYQNKTVIASKRNSNAVRVFIPEKLRVNGVRYVQPYKFMRISASTQGMIVTLRDELNLFVSILRNEVVVSAPFSMELIRSYLDQLSAHMLTHPANKYQIISETKRGDTWDHQFMAGKGKLTAL